MMQRHSSPCDITAFLWFFEQLPPVVQNSSNHDHGDSKHDLNYCLGIIDIINGIKLKNRFLYHKKTDVILSKIPSSTHLTVSLNIISCASHIQRRAHHFPWCLTFHTTAFCWPYCTKLCFVKHAYQMVIV